MSGKHRSQARDPFSHSAFLSSSGISLDKDGLIHRSNGNTGEQQIIREPASRIRSSDHHQSTVSASQGQIIRRDKRDRSYPTPRVKPDNIPSSSINLSVSSKRKIDISTATNNSTALITTPQIKYSQTPKSAASSSVSSNVSSWQLERYQKAKLRSRQSAMSRQSQHNQNLTNGKNVNLKTTTKLSLDSHTQSSISDSRHSNNTESDSKIFKAKLKSKILDKNDDLNSTKRNSHKISISSEVSSMPLSYTSPSPVLKEIDCNSPRVSNNQLNDMRGITKPSDTIQSLSTKSDKMYRTIQRGKESSSQADRRSDHSRRVTEKPSSTLLLTNKAENSSKRYEEKILAVPSMKKSTQYEQKRDESFEKFMYELKKEVSVDHTQLWGDFQTMLGSKSTTPTLDGKSYENESEKDRGKRRKRARLSTTSQKQLQSIHKSLSKQVSSTHLASKSQLLDDKTLERKQSQARKMSTTEVLGSSTDSAKHDSRVSKKNSLLKERRRVKPKTESLMELPMEITISDQGCDMDDSDMVEGEHAHAQHESDDSLETIASTATDKRNEVKQPTQDTVIDHNPSSTKSHNPSDSKKNLLSRITTSSSRPPLPPQPKAPEKPKKSLSWLSVLREKQKRRKNELKKNDDESVNTTDLETSAANAIGRSKVISIFGKRVSLVSRETEPKANECEDNKDGSGSNSPWNVKLRPVSTDKAISRKETLPSPINHTPAKLPPATKTAIPFTPDRGHFVPVSKPTPTKKHCSLSLGDTINLKQLPEAEFDVDSDVTIMPLSNNAGSQVIVVGKELVVIAARLSQHADEGSVDEDKAIVLWHTYRTNIQSLTLNPEATGALISVVDGASYPLTFETSERCFAFAQAFYRIQSSMPKQSSVHVESTGNGLDDTLDTSNSEHQHPCVDTSAVTQRSESDNGTFPPVTNSMAITDSQQGQGDNTGNSSHCDEGQEGLASVHTQLLNSIKLRGASTNATKKCIEDSSISKSKELTEDEEKAVNKYRKMLKISIPVDAVKQKMAMEEASDHVINAVLGDKSEKEDTRSLPVVVKEQNREQETEPEQTLDDSQEEIASKYRKMLKVGLPPEAVRHKMKKDQVGNDIIDAVLGVIQPSGLESKTSESTKLSDEDENQAILYRKMLKLGIPPDGVRHKMLKDNVATHIVESVLGCDKKPKLMNKEQPTLSKEEEATVSKYRKLLKNGVPPEAVRHKMTKDQVEDRIADAVLGPHNTTKISVRRNKDICGAKRKSRFMGFHWTPISEEQINKTLNIFNASKKRKGDSAIEPGSVDMSKLEELFQKKTNTQRGISGSKGGGDGKQMAKLIKLERAQNVSIQLHKFKEFTFDELVTIIDDLDPGRKIEGERLQFLKGLLPLEEEVRNLESYNGDDTRLVPAEIFLRKLLSIRRVRNKVTILQTMGMFDQSATEVVSGFNTLTTVCSEIIESEKLQLVLEAVLTIGNIMNEGTRTGGAAGFKFDSLLKLTQTKSMDGKMTVLDYIVQMFIAKDEREVLYLSEEFPDCSDASRILITDLVINSSSLRSFLQDCKSELIEMTSEQSSRPVTTRKMKKANETCAANSKESLFAELLSRNNSNDDDSTEPDTGDQVCTDAKDMSAGLVRLQEFFDYATKEMNKVDLIQKRSIQACKDLATYCGEDGGERAATTVMGVLTEFMACMEQAVKKHDKIKELEAKQKAAQKVKHALALEAKPKNGSTTAVNKQIVNGHKPFPQSTEQHIKPNTSEISDNNRERDRESLLDSIKNRQAPPSNDNAIDARQAMLNSILNRRLSSSPEEDTSIGII